MSDSDSREAGLFRDRNFLVYWFGTAISLLGDALSMVALPWLVLQMTGDSSQLGLVMAVQALPRALLMLFGGVAADHFSPRVVLLSARGVSIFVLAALGSLVTSGALELWMVYPFALVLGTIGAFQIPAAMSIIPTIVAPSQLRAANTAFQGTAQLSMLLGPAIAGLLIALLSNPDVPGGNIVGIGYAFLIDAATFVVSTLSLFFVRARLAEAEDAGQGVLARIGSGIRYTMSDSGLRAIVIYIASVNFFIIGVILVGLPVFAETSLGLGVKGYGYLMSALGGGSLAGTLLAGVLPSPPRGARGKVLFTLSSVVGLLIAVLPHAGPPAFAMGVVLLVGVLSGFANIHFITWMQQRAEPAMIGRVMSLVMLANLGVIPFSSLIIGFAIKGLGLAIPMAVGGLAFSAIALGSLLDPVLRRMDTPEEEAASAAKSD